MTRARDLGDFIADGAAAELVVDTTTLVVDSTNNRVGIGTASPSQALEVTGTAKLATVDIDAGAIDGAVIGANSAAAGTFTALTASGTTTITTADINGGAIDGTIIGANSASTGAFSTGSFTGDVSIADKIVHTGDTNTAIRFPAADTVSFETAGSERLRVGSAGQVGIAGANYGTSGQVLTSGGSGAAPSWVDASGGGGLELTTSEAVVEGDKLAWNFTTGKVEKVGRIGGNSKHYIYNSASGANIQIYDVLHIPEINKVAVLGARSDGNKVVYLGTFNGTSWTWGTPFEGDAGGSGAGGKLVWAANVSRLVAIYKSSNSGNNLKWRLLSASGSNLTSAGQGVFATSSVNLSESGNQVQAVYSPTHQRIIVGYKMSASPEGLPIIVGNVSSSSISWSAEQGPNGSAPNQRWNPANQEKNLGIAVNGSQIAFGCYSASSSRYYVLAATMSGSTLTFGASSGNTISSTYAYSQNSRGQLFHVSHSSTANLFSYGIFGSSGNYLFNYHFTVSGTSISPVNSYDPYQWAVGSSFSTNGAVMAYDPSNKRAFVFRSNDKAAYSGTNDNYLIGNGNQNTTILENGENSQARSATFDADSGRAVLINSQNPSRIYTYLPIVDNFYYFVGCAKEAASANTTVKIANSGQIATGLSGLTAGNGYRIDYSGGFTSQGSFLTDRSILNGSQRSGMSGLALTTTTMLILNDFMYT